VIVTTTHAYEIAFKYSWVRQLLTNNTSMCIACPLFSHFVIIGALLQACTAPQCGVIIQRHSRSVDIARHCCGKCKAKLIEIEVPSGKGSNVEQTPKKKKALSGYNLFVKQNSKLVRERLVLERSEGSYGKVTQPDVLRECARLWRELNQNSHE
jgi:ribosomal protein S27AE